MNMSQELEKGRLQSRLDGMGGLQMTSGRISTAPDQQVANWAATTKMRPITWAGLKGVALTPSTSQSGKSSSLAMVARGNKMYMYIADSTNKKPIQGLKALLSSFRPR